MAYEDLFDPADDKKAKAGLNLRYGIEAAPDVAARDASLAKRYGLPAGVIEQYRPDYDARAKVEDAGQLLDQSPKLRDWLAADPIRAKVSHDDIGNLSAIESAIRYLVSAPGAPRGGMVADVGNLGVSALKGAVGLPQAIVGLADIPTLGRAGKLVESAGLRFKDAQGILDTFYSDAQQQANKEVQDASGFMGTLGAMARNPSTIVQTGVESLPLMLGGAGVARGLLAAGGKAVAPGMAGPALPGFLARTFGQAAPLVAGAAGEGVIAAGSAAENYREAGGVLTVGQVAAAIASGTGTGALSVIGGKVAQKLGVADIDTALASGALKGEEVKKGLIRTLAEAGVSEGLLEEMPQSAQEQIWQNIATDKPVMDGVAEAAAQGLMAGAATGGAFAGVSRRFSRESQGAAQAQMSAQQLDTIASLAEASKLKARSPETFAEFANELAQSSVPTIFVDAQALMQSGVNIQEVAQAMPSVAAQLQQAVATGGDIEIPTAEFVQAVPGSTFQQQLIDHARTGANAMSRAEADVFMKDKGDAIKAEIEAEAARHEQDADWQMQRDEVRAGFEQQLNAAGRFQPAVNKSYAAVLGDFYAVTASRAGMTPKELVQRYPLRIQATAPGGVVNAMEQTAARAIPTGKTSPITRKPIMELFDAAGQRIGLTHSYATPEDAVSGFNAPKPPPPSAPTYTVPEKEVPARTNWKQVKGEKFTGLDDDDGFLYHVTAAPRAGGIRQNGLAPNSGGMFGGAYASHSAGKVFLTERSGVSFWKSRVEDQLQHASDNPPAVVVMRIPKDKIKAELKPDDIGTKDARARAYYSTETLRQSARLPATIDIDGQQRPTTNSKGQQIAATEEGVRAFYRWFKDSKVVDAEGKPLVVYHGTGADITEFKPSKLGAYGGGIYLTPDIAGANDYAQYRGAPSSTVYPLYVKIENPATGAEAANTASWRGEESAMQALQDKGHDGVMARGEVVAFTPEQVKSATGNSTFDPESPSILNQSAYHGTPHRGIDRFTTEKIGTGEGAQAYGWGLYFASKREIAEWYRDALSTDVAPPQYIVDGNIQFEGQHDAADPREAYIYAVANGGDGSKLADQYEDQGANEAFVAGVRAAHDALKSAKIERKDTPGGQLYEVDIPEDSEMLLWDRPLSEQPAKAIKSLKSVREALTEAGVLDDYLERKNADWEELTGQDVYEIVKRASLDDALPSNGYGVEEAQAAGQDDKAASLWLWNEGLAGIKYLDGTSRGAGDGSFNYVIFSGDDVAIKNTFYQGEKARAQIAFGPDITQTPSIISLFNGADLSSFIHEAGHFFLEAHMDLAGRIAGRVADGEQVSDGERGIVADANALLGWFGVQGDETAGGATGGALMQGADIAALESELRAAQVRVNEEFQKVGLGPGVRVRSGGARLNTPGYLAAKAEAAAAQQRLWDAQAARLKAATAGRPVVRNKTDSELPDVPAGHVRLFHSSAEEVILGIDGDRGIFGGLFAASSRGRASGPGVAPYMHYMDVPESAIADHGALNRARRDGGKAAEKAIDAAIRAKSAGGITAKEVQAIKEAAIDDQPDGVDGIEPGRFANLAVVEHSVSGREAPWLVQMYRGQVAKALGFQAVTMRDEHGTSYLVLPGVAVRPAHTSDVLYQGGQTDARPEPPALGRTPLETWAMMSIDQKRPYHEQFARSFELYALEGKAPSLALQFVFQRFSAWLKDVYRSITQRAAEDVLQVSLTDEVRQVMDRMIATEEQIKEAETARAMGPLFTERGGMTPEQWAAYQAQGEKATQAAVDALQSRALADMKWLSNARAAKLRELQKQADALRRDIRREVTREVMSRPVYRAWAFLTGKGEEDQKAQAEPRGKGSSGELDTATDNIFQAIAKLGGLRRDEVQSQWGLDAKAETISSGVFGRPVVRKEGGLSIDMMTEALVSEGYLMPDENGRGDTRDLEEAFDSQRMGVDQFSVAHDYAARVAAANGEAPVEPLPDYVTHGKLNTTVLREMYGTQADAIWRKLSDRRMTSESGIQPDVLAETMGYASGDAMVRELADALPPRDVIRDLTDQRMLQEHGELSTPEGLERATTEALANKVRTRFLAQELQALEDAGKAEDKPGKDGKVRRTASALDKAAEVYAAKTIGAMQIKDIKPHKFEAAATRAAKLAAKAFKAGKTAEAAMHKRSELIQMHAAKAAHEALAEVQKARDHFGDIARRSLDKLGKTYDIDVVQAIRAVLAEYGVGTKGEQAAQYLTAVERNDPDMHKVLKAQIEGLTADARPIDTLTVDSLRALVDEVGAMWHLARRSKQMEVDGNLIDREEVQAELLARLEEIGIPDTMPGEGKAVTDKERRISRIREAAAALMRVENWAIRKDGADNGVFTRFVFRPIKAAADAYRAEHGQVLRKYRDLLAGVNLGVGRISAPELGYEFGFSKGGSGKAELLHAILHTGNDSNKRKLLLGRKWADVMQDGETVDTGRWDRFVERMIREGVLTKADFDFAQGVWDLLESLKPSAQKTHRDVFGRYFDEVTANPVTNSLGTWAGGYVPAMTDAEVVKDAKTRDLAEAENSTMAFAFPATAKGFTKARVEYNKPLLLDLRALAGHIDKVLLFSHLEQPVRDVRRVLSSGQVAEPMHKVDPAAFGSLITPWLNRAARQQVETPIPGDGGTMRVLSKLRARAGMAAMMANISNTAQQITGFSIAAVKVPPRHLMSAAHRWITSPRKTSEAVSEASVYMRNRMDNETAAMTQEIQQILLNPSLYEKAQDWTARHAYFMQSAVDNVMGPIIWTGAYNNALEQGQSEDDARATADGVVRQTQGSTLAEDVSRIETGNAWWRMFAQFAGYFNMQANLLGTEFSNQMRDLGLRRGMGKGLYIFTLGFLVPALVSELIVQAFRGGPDDEDKDGETLDDWLAALGVGTIRSSMAMVPVVGQMGGYALNLRNDKPYDDRISTAPAISMLESAIRAPFSVYEAAVNDKSAQKAVRDVATLISLTTGLPANAIARPVGYVAGMADDRIDPTSQADAARGLLTGVASPASKP